MAKKNGKKKIGKQQRSNKNRRSGKVERIRDQAGERCVPTPLPPGDLDGLELDQQDLNALLGDPREFMARARLIGEMCQSLYVDLGLEETLSSLCDLWDENELDSPLQPILCVDPDHRVTLQLHNVSPVSHYVNGSHITPDDFELGYSYCTEDPKPNTKPEMVQFLDRTLSYSGKRRFLSPRGTGRSVLAIELPENVMPASRLREKSILCAVEMTIDGSARSEFAVVVFDEPSRILRVAGK